MKKTANNIVKLGLSLGVSIFLGAFIRAYLPRVLGVEGVGKLYFAESIATLVFTFLPLGLHAYINRTVTKDSSQVKKVYSTLANLTLVWGFILLLGVATFATLAGYEADKWQLLMFMSVFNLLFQHNTSVLKPLFLAADQVNFVSRTEIIGKFCQTIIVCGGVYLFPDLFWVGFFYVISQSIVSILFLFKSIRLSWWSFKSDLKIFYGALAISLPFLLNAVMVSMYGQLDIAIMEYLANSREIGWYGSAQKLKGLFLLAIPLIFSAVSPNLGRSYHEGPEVHAKFLSTAFSVLIYISFGMSMVMSLLGPELVMVLFGDDFGPSSMHMVLLAPVLLFTYLNVLLAVNQGIVSNGRALTLATFLSILINAGANFYFIPTAMELMGPGGAGVGAAMTTILAEVFVFIWLLKATKSPLLRAKNAIVTVLCFILMVACVVFQMTYSPGFVTRASLLLSMAIVVTAAFVWANGNDLKMLKDKILKR